MRKILYLVFVIALLGAFGTNHANAAEIFTATHSYDFGTNVDAIDIKVDVFNNYLGDFSKYLWQYTVTNNSFDPLPGTSNGFSGFETALPAAVPDLGDQFAPSPLWIDNGFSGLPVEWDLTNSDGMGLLPGDTGVFGFTSLPRLITNSTGWFHTWVNDGQAFITNYSDTLDAQGLPALGPEVPDVLAPPISTVPEPSTFLLFGAGLAGVGLLRRRFKK